jgi:hypothetical protein
VGARAKTSTRGGGGALGGLFAETEPQPAKTSEVAAIVIVIRVLRENGAIEFFDVITDQSVIYLD